MACFNIREYTLPGQHIREFARGTANAQGELLQVAVKEYVPKDNPEPKEGDVTIIGAHANGFPKVSRVLVSSLRRILEDWLRVMFVLGYGVGLG
jgi:hypothetical protein